MNSFTDFRRLRQRHAHHVGLGDQQRHRREIADRVVAQRRIEELVGGKPWPDDEDGVAVGIGTGHHVGGDVAAGAGLVLDHHRLAPHLLQAVADQPRGDVSRAARRKRHHDAHRSLRPFGAGGALGGMGGACNCSGGEPDKTAALEHGRNSLW
jgi:hypothetical protein